MTRQLLASLALLAVAACSCRDGAPAPASGPPSGPPPASAATAKMRGVSWVAGREVSRDDLRPLADHHVDWIAQTPFGWQRRIDSPEVRLVTSGRVYWGERDVGLETTARFARELGISTLLKPHVWLTEAGDGEWLGSVRMRSEADWQAWFASYREFILHYARLAERLEMSAFSIGLEFHAAVVERPDDWRRLIADVRQVYHGRLTYAANWWREYEEVLFWDDLDAIGIQAYFPLTTSPEPSVAELRRGWQPHLAAIERLAQRVGKPVIFTEIGYRSTPDAAIAPWEWLDGADLQRLTPDPETQARCYEAFFAEVWDRPWFAGAFFWKWFPDLRHAGSRAPFDFTPQGKPAAVVLRSGYAAEGEKGGRG